MSETRSRISEDNILHIAEVAVHRRKRNIWRTALLLLLVIPIVIGLVDLARRAASLFRPAQAAAQTDLNVRQPGMVYEISTHTLAEPSIVPHRIRIPALGVDARVVHVGVSAQGRMQAPADFAQVGWYKNGSKPGEEGSAVFGGHVNDALARGGVFEHLSRLASGDEIVIADAGGRELVYRVYAKRVYAPEEAPLAEIFSRAGPSQAVLVTCEGKWDKERREFSHRLVVYASLAASN